MRQKHFLSVIVFHSLILLSTFALAINDPGIQPLPIDVSIINSGDISRSDLAEILSGQAPAIGIGREAPSQAEIISALDLDASMILSAEYFGHNLSCAALPNLGVVSPVAGNGFILMSNGVAGAGIPPNGYPEPGTDMGMPNFDLAKIVLQIEVPIGASRISFDFNFFSAEYPDFIGSAFNDEFEAILTSSLGTINIAHDAMGNNVSVNSAEFFAVNDQDAGGTGFDIYCPDPEGTDSEFPGGLPDAGLTRFHHVESVVPGGETVTLEFRVFDRGDSVFDSAVLIDNLYVGGLEIVDARPDYFGGQYLHNQSVVLDDIAIGGLTRVGTVSDGTSRLLIRYRAPGPGQVSLELNGPPQSGLEKGFLSPVNSIDEGLNVGMHTHEINNGHYAFFIYTPPNSFGDFDWLNNPVVKRKIMLLNLSFQPDGGGEAVTEQGTFQLNRTPVLFVHGIKSSPAMWNHVEHQNLTNNWGISFKDVNYKNTNTESFDVNVPKLELSAYSLMLELLLQDIACSQVCVVAHSMGGNLARCWENTPDYYLDSNYNEGIMHMLLTVDTPHYGSEVPEVLLGLMQSNVWCPSPQLSSLINLIQLTQGPISGAHVDLSPGSDALMDIGATPDLFCRAIVGTGGSSFWINAPIPISAFSLVETLINEIRVTGGPTCWFLPVFNPGIFGGDDHDYVVTASSQRGGLDDLYVTENEGMAGVHTAVYQQDLVWTEEIIPNLRFGPGGYSQTYDGFPAPVYGGDAVTTSNEPLLDLRSYHQLLPAGMRSAVGPEILSPAPGAVYQTGAEIAVEVNVEGFDSENLIFVSKNGDWVSLDPETGTGTIVLQENISGAQHFKLFGFYSNGTASESAFRQVVIQPQGDLVALNSSPQQEILEAAGREFQLHIYGEYADGTVQELTEGALGTTYSSDNNNIASVSANGRVVGMGVGVTTIVASYGGQQATVRVEILEGAVNSPPIVNVGGPYLVCVGDTLCLDETTAIDPDGENGYTLAFDWDLDEDGLFGDSVSSTPCVIPGAAGEYNLTIRVSDVFGATTEANIEVVAENCGPVIHGLLPGDLQSGQTAFIFGLAFGPDPGVGSYSTDENNVMINGNRISDDSIQAWSENLIEFILPTGVSGGTIMVSAEGLASYQFEFIVGEIPECLWTSSGHPELEASGASYGLAWGDYDGDTFQDLFVTRNGTNLLYHNDGGTSFSLVDDTLGSGNDCRTASWADYDNDGDLDLYVVINNDSNILFNNDGGVFIDVTAGPEGDAGFGYNATWADIDQNGFVDLFVANAGGFSHLLLNDGGVFTESPELAPIEGIVRSCTFADYDNDQMLDLYVGMYGPENRLFHNEGQGVLAEIIGTPINCTGLAKGLAWGDFDNDGDLDLFVVNNGQANRFFRNDLAGGFVDITDPLLADEGMGRSCAWEDYDNDGWLDLLVTNVDSSPHLYHNLQGNGFEEAACGDLAAYTGLSWSSGFADYDNDGDYDLFLTDRDPGGDNRLFDNLSITGNFLKVSLQGTKSNSFGVGARVIVHDGMLSRMRDMTGSSGYLTSSPLDMIIGLGDAQIVDVEIRWPSGIVQIVENVSVNSNLAVVETASMSGVDHVVTPLRFEINNYPNPFNPSTTIKFALPKAAQVSLNIYDVQGKLVSRICQNEQYGTGYHSLEWHGRNSAGRIVPSGLYFYRVTAGSDISTGRMTLLK